jgi:hypothetical protein
MKHKDPWLKNHSNDVEQLSTPWPSAAPESPTNHPEEGTQKWDTSPPSIKAAN